MKLISVEKIIEIAQEYLKSCDWKLELEEGEIITVPASSKLVVASRAYIKEDLEGYTWGDHYQAKVLIEPAGEHNICKYGTLGLYIDLNERLISGDHGRYI